MGKRGFGSWSVIKRGTKRYSRFRITISGKTHERVGSTRASLEKAAAELQRRARRGLVTDDEEITLTDWAARWLEAKTDELGAAGAKTLRNYRSVLEKHVLPLLGSVKVRDLRAEHRRRLQRKLVAAGLKVSTINKIDDTLRFCLQAAANEEMPVVVSVLTAVKHVKAPPEAKRSLTAEDVRTLLARSDPPWRVVWALFAFTGARDAEVRALKWTDWSQDAGTITIQRQLPQSPGDPPKWQHWIKGRKLERVVPVVEPLAVALREHRARQAEARLKVAHLWSANDLIFCDEVGRALPHERVLRAFHRACEDAGIEVWKGLGVHALRHSCNNLLREVGVDAPLRSQILGHTKAVNEGIYTAENVRLAAAAMSKLAEALG